MNKKVFIVSEFVDSKQNSTGYYWAKIIAALSGRREKIKVISSKKSMTLAQQNFNKPNVEFLFVRDKKENKINIITRAINDIIFSLRIAKKVFWQSKKNDLVMTGTNPSFLFFFLSLIKIFKKFKLVVLVHDVFPENLIPSKVVSKKYYFLLKPIIFLFNLSYSNANTLIAIGRDMKTILSKKIYSTNLDIKYIPNFVDLNDIKIPIGVNKIDKKITFNFFGNLGLVQGIENLLSAISITDNSNIKFNFIGNGIAEKYIEAFIKNNPSLDVNLYRDLSFENKNEMLYIGNIAIVSLSEGMKGLAVPSKTYFSMAANKPILAIADENSELQMLINENKNIGWFCVAGNPRKLAALINKIYEDGVDENNEQPLLTIKQFYEYSKIKTEYINLIDQI